jgi:Zn ribbon nucleic-acid-binding protein
MGLTMQGDVCPSCSCRDVLSHRQRSVCDGVLFWSCSDCGFAWPRFSSPISSCLVQISIRAAEDYVALSRRSDRSGQVFQSTATSGVALTPATGSPPARHR